MNSSAPASAAAARTASGDASGSPSRMLSATLARNSVGCWGTQATRRRHASSRHSDRSTSPTVIRPLVGDSSPSSIAATVLLPAPLSPTSGHELAGRQLEVEPIEHRDRTGRVRERDSLEPHLRGRGARREPRTAGADRGRGVEQLEHPLGHGQPVRARVVLGAEPAIRQIQLGREDDHGQPRLQPEAAADEPDAGRDRDQRHADSRRQLEHGARQEADPKGFHRRLAVALCRPRR